MPGSRLHALITGRVQGVGFRYFALREARRLGLTGFVRNLRSGQVEIVAEGEQSDLDHLQSLLEEGPDGAHVTNVQASAQDYRQEFESFDVRPGS
jgi:acylphosphatase